MLKTVLTSIVKIKKEKLRLYIIYDSFSSIMMKEYL